MCIYGNGRNTKCVRYDNISCLTANTWQLRKFSMPLWYITAIIVDKHLAQLLDMGSFVAKKTYTSNILLQFLNGDCQIISRCLIFLKQASGDLIDCFIRTLRRKQNSNRQFKWIAVVQLAMCIREHLSHDT